MKKIFMFAAAALALCACSKELAEVNDLSNPETKAPEFTQSPPPLLFCSSDAQVLTLNFAGNFIWSIDPQDDTPWSFISIDDSQRFGLPGAQSISINVEKNEESTRRDDILVISGIQAGVTISYTIHVLQDPAATPPTPTEPFTITPIFTFQSPYVLKIGESIDFTLTGIDEVRMGGGDSTITFVGMNYKDWDKYISVAPVPGEPKKVRVTNIGMWGGLIWPIQFHRCADGALTEESHVSISYEHSSSDPFVEVTPGIYGSSQSTHSHGNYWDIGTGSYSLYFNLNFKSRVTGKIKVTLEPWGTTSINVDPLDYMFKTTMGTQGFNFYYQKDVTANPLIAVMDNTGVAYIENSVKSISVQIPAIGSTLYRLGKITFEYGSERISIYVTQQPPYRPSN